MQGFRGLFLVAMLCLVGCDYLRLRSIGFDLKNSQCAPAKLKILKALQDTHHEDVYQYNLIHALLCEKQMAEALKQIDYILEEKYPVEFQALFIKGYVLGEMGQTDEALRAYQQALLIYQDKKIKQNMELLLQANSGKKQGSPKNGKQQDPNKKDQKGESSKQDEAQSQDKDQDSNQKNSVDTSEHDEKQQQQESQKQKNLSKEQIEQIMKEIDGEEKEVRSQGIETKKGQGQKSDKNW